MKIRPLFKRAQSSRRHIQGSCLVLGSAGGFRTLDARTDLFSFGVVLYEMSTGVLPFRGESTGVIFEAILSRAPVPAVRLNPDVPADLERIISKCLEKDRNLRYQHASELRTDLERLRRDRESTRVVAIDPASAPTVDSLAVLPLVNATGDPETEYLSDGISESVINLLSQFPKLRVIPRTSAFRYKGRDVDLKTVGRDLKVRTVLTGKMIQRGDRLVVQTELVDLVNDAQLWGGHFNRKLEDIFDVQEELARQIFEKLRLRLTAEDENRLAKRPTQSRDAYQFLLRAQYHLSKLPNCEGSIICACKTPPTVRELMRPEEGPKRRDSGAARMKPQFDQRRGSNKSVAAPVDKAGTSRTGPVSGAAATRFSSSAENCVFWHAIARRNAS
jgi:TolB-like protein